MKEEKKKKRMTGEREIKNRKKEETEGLKGRGVDKEKS